MADPTFNLFGPIKGTDVRVGYISTDRGYIQGVDVCAANVHAKKNPGEVFIYKPKRDTVQFLNINQVNKLREDPDLASKDMSCPDGLNMNAEVDPQVTAKFMGGGGVGVVGNPVVSSNGTVMALHLVNGGYGYQYPPIVHIQDDSNIGSGAVVKVGVGTTYSAVQYYLDKEDFEEYNLCENPFTDPSKIDGGIDSKIAGRRSPYGRRWSSSGKDLGAWRPQSYTDDGKPPFDEVLDQYIKQLNESGKDWFTTRKNPPLKITSEGKTTKEVHKVQHWSWGPGTKSPLSIVPFEILWSSPHRTKGLGFEFTAQDGSHKFRIVDTSGKGSGKRVDSYQVKENVTYNVRPIGKKPVKKDPDKRRRVQESKITELAEIGLLKKLGFGGGKADKNILDANKEGTGDKIFADFLNTLDDADDLQIQAKRGKFTAFNPRWVQGLRRRRKTFDLTYRLETGREELSPSFMNKYAISPKPPSNIKGSDFAGHWYTFEWDLDFPYDGEYIIRTARDNRSRIYFDGVSYTDKLQTFTGTNPESGEVGPRGGHANKVTFKKGPKTLKLELYNNPHMGTVITQQPPPATTSDITFRITSGSMFANGVRIEELDINEVKSFTPVGMGKKGQLNVTHTRKIEYGKKYKVVFTSTTSGIGGVLGGIKYTGLKEGGLRRANSTRLEFDDNPTNGFDVNASFTVDRGKAKFSADGRTLEGRGDVTLTLSWDDNPNISGRALNKIDLGGKTWTITPSKTGSQTHTIDLGRKYGAVNPRIRLRTTEPNIIQMEDWTDNDWTDIIVNASGGQFTDLKDNIAYFSVPHPPEQVGGSIDDNRKTVEVFNTIDYINRASRRLWRTNVYARGGFLNEYGVCPFDTRLQLKDNPYAGVHRIAWPNVNFPHSGNYNIEVAVDDNVNLTIGNQVKIEKRGFVEGTSVSTGVLKLTRFIKAGRHTITADLEQIPGGRYSFRHLDKKVNKSEVKFHVKGNSWYTNTITIPGLFSFTKISQPVAERTGRATSQSFINQVEEDKEYDVIFSSVEGNPRLRIRDKGRRVEMEDLNDNQSWDDLVCTVNNGEFYGVHGNRCKFRADRTIKGINPMGLAINIESTYTQKKAITPTSWNQNPMGVAMTIEAPPPPIPVQPVPKAEGRCPNNPYWTTRFPGAKERWYPVRVDGWGELLNAHGISPLPPYNKHINAVANVSFDVYWASPHRKKGLGYKFTAQDGSHSFTIIDTSKKGHGKRTETHKVKVNTTYNVKAIGQRAHLQGGKIGKTILGKHDNSKVIELAEQGLLKKIGIGGLQERKTNRLDANRTGTGDKIFADFLDTLDDSDDLQIQAGAGKFTASNQRTVDSLRGKRQTYDLTYRLNEVPPNDAGNFTNTWTKSFEFGGYYKALLEADDIAELWIDDKKVLDTDRRKNKTYDEQLIWIDGPTSDDEFKKNGPTNHEIKVVVENFKSEKMKQINAKVFTTMDWMSGSGTRTAEKKTIEFKITSSSLYANGIKIPELGISESKKYDGGQINVTRQKEVQVNKVYDVEFSSSLKGSMDRRTIKYVGEKRPLRITRNNKRIEFDDNPANGWDTNVSFTIDRGNVKFSDDGNSLIVKGNEATFTFDWNDNPNIAGRGVESIQIGDKVWRITQDVKGSITKNVKFARNTDNTANIKLRNKGESVVQMEDLPPSVSDWDWQDLVCAATEGRFFDFNGNKCKFMVGSTTRAGRSVGGGTTKDGVTYQGPHLFHYRDSRWGKVMNREGVSPIASPSQSLSDPNENILGWKILTWKNVHFPQTGKYQISFVADNGAKLFIGNKEVLASKTYELNEYNNTDVEVGKGNHDIRVEIFNANHRYRATHDANDLVFLKNPTGVALRIYTKMIVGSGTYRSWAENPMGVSAKLIPPPCPKPSKGKGRVVDPIVIDGGNKYQPSPEPRDPGSPGTYPVRLKMKEPIITNEGINYNCAKDGIRLEPSNGVKLSLCQCGPFGKVEKVCIEYEGGPDGGSGYFTEPPEIIVDSPTGVNLQIQLQFEPVIVPFDIPDDVIQVTDLVGLKQTGYYKGKPYYGAVFYENGIKYSGWYKTAGEMVQVYDTMQESIDAMVTTPPSAIQRQGSDVSSNDPRLDIPGTPENLI